ncbi:Hsp70 family protein [Geodermatophilus sp. SYSU D01176]
MRNDEYGLGVDVGDGAVSAAVCGVDGGAVPLPLGEGRVTAVVGDDERTALVPADGTARSPHLVARVGDPVPVYAGGRGVAAADLVADVVQRVRELAAAREGRPDSWTVVTVPPSWAGHRCAALARALAAAGVPRFSLVSSAVAAVSAHVAAGDLPAEPTAAVYDLGAGSLDTAVVGPTADDPLAHLAVPPAPLAWGGRDIDDVVLAHVVGCLGTPVGDAGALRAACATAKEALSTATAVRVDVDGVGDGPVRLTREELDEVLDEPVRRSVAVLAAAAAAAGLAPEDLDAVVLTGGGVRVPLVAEVLSGELGRPLVVGDDPALTPALGAAALAAEALAVDALAPDPTVAGTAAVEMPPVPPEVATAATEERQLALPPARGPRDRSRPASAPRAATRPPRRARRVGRGVVLTGLVLGLLLLGPAAAGLFDAVLAPAPSGGQAVAEADDGGVVARGSAAVGDSDSGAAVARGGDDAEAAAPRTSAGSPGSPARTSLAAALATAARTGPPSGSGSAEPDSERAAPGSTTAASGTTPRGSATATPGTPTAQTPGAPGTSSGPTTSAGTPPVPGQSTASQPPVSEPPASQPPASEPPASQPPASEPPASEPLASELPASEPPASQPPAEPQPQQPAAEQPTGEQPDSEAAPPPADTADAPAEPA